MFQCCSCSVCVVLPSCTRTLVVHLRPLSLARLAELPLLCDCDFCVFVRASGIFSLGNENVPPPGWARICRMHPGIRCGRYVRSLGLYFMLQVILHFAVVLIVSFVGPAHVECTGVSGRKRKDSEQSRRRNSQRRESGLLSMQVWWVGAVGSVHTSAAAT
jgi:hypothetical protein